jgi:dihydropyrimidine dehydrogenase (NAD+) subunit PreA
LKSKGLADAGSLTGKALPKLTSHDSLDRNYRIKPNLKEGCSACGRCVTACRDAGGNALQIGNEGLTCNESACSGCALCKILCPLL